ncbi:MAG: GNAT family N-acetyltransferase [Chloroflexota bacterium]
MLRIETDKRATLPTYGKTGSAPTIGLPTIVTTVTPGPITVTEVTDRTAFMRIQPEWDALVQRTCDQPFYRHGFIRVWLDNFAPSVELRVLLARDEEGNLVGALPLMAERGSMYGAPVRRLVAAANDHSCRFDMIAWDSKAVGAAFFSRLVADTSWDVLCIRDVPEEGNARQLYEAAQAAGFPCGAWESLRSPYIALPGSPEAYESRLSAKHKSNLRRRRKNLSTQGRVSVEQVTGSVDLSAKLEEGFALEASGWKGRKGTAISQEAATWGFYSELARNESYRGALSLYFLRLDGKPLAFQYGLLDGGAFYLLKPSYDEAYKEYSPGHLLMQDVVRDCIAREMLEFDFLGPDMPWKRDWTGSVRRHDWLFIFRDSRYGRLLHGAKFRWAPYAKRVVSRGRADEQE